MPRQPRVRGDAPASTSKNPNPAAAGLFTDPDEDSLVERTVTINRPRHELYAFWRDFRNLPLFMENIESVTVMDDNRSHWRVKAPAGTTVEWNSIITEDVPGELIAWRSGEDASVKNSGRIEFRDSTNGRGTLVTRHHRLRPTGRQAREGVRDAVPARAEGAGAAGPAPLQAADGDRRDLDFPAARSRATRR